MGDGATKRHPKKLGIQIIQKGSINSIKRAFDENVNEVNFFIHVHLRHYDEKGEGKKQDGMFVDQYGAPIPFHDNWTDGYKAIEKALFDHNGLCQNKHTYFPLVGGYSGGTHLYEKYNKEKPWDWTGWIPQQNMFPYNVADGCTVKYYNRFFIALRGNEIQNDMWDYDPGSTEVDNEVKGPYLGGYWFQGEDKARYLHIMSLKTCLPNDNNRYNYIVHPLAYRSALDILPGVEVDGIQWSVNNIMREKNIKMKEWGEEVNGIELFNDYTFYYTWIGNGNKRNGSSNGEYIEWFDTYPLEYCEFILDTALSNGVYLQALSANDVFYNRNISHIDNEATKNEDTQPAVNEDGKPESLEDMEPHERMLQHQILLSDPKGKYAALKLKNGSTESNIDITELQSMWPKRWLCRRTDKLAVEVDELIKSNKFMKTRPYGYDTVFGYTTLLDTESKLKNSVFPETPGCSSGIEINKGESYVLDMLRKGQFYSHTGIYGIFNYDDQNSIPIFVEGQKNPMEMWYNELEENFKMVFQFPPERTKESFPCNEEIPPWVGKLIWRYTIEYVNSEEKKERVLTTGYFKLSENTSTQLDLQYYAKYQVKWIRFTAFYADNPMQRVWFSPIKGPYFSEEIDDYPNSQNQIAVTTKINTEDPNGPIYLKSGGEYYEPKDVDSDNLEFTLDERDEENLHCYFLQVSAVVGPEAPNAPRYLENVHGYFPVHQHFPTKLVLSNSWDITTVKDKKVFFYKVNQETCDVENIFPVHASTV